TNCGRRTLKTLLIILTSYLAGCQTTSQPGADEPSGEDLQPVVEQAISAAQIAEADDSSIIEEATIEEGFCKDDVYATYLRERYLNGVASGKKAVSRSKSERRKQELEGLFFARSRLVGPMSEFYGTLPVVANSRVEYW